MLGAITVRVFVITTLYVSEKRQDMMHFIVREYFTDKPEGQLFTIGMKCASGATKSVTLIT